MSTLSEKFEKFVGRIVKHPGRASHDICDATVELDNAAFDEDMTLVFNIAGQPIDTDFDMDDDDILIVNLEKNDKGQLVVDSFKIVLE